MSVNGHKSDKIAPTTGMRKNDRDRSWISRSVISFKY